MSLIFIGEVAALEVVGAFCAIAAGSGAVTDTDIGVVEIAAFRAVLKVEGAVVTDIRQIDVADTAVVSADAIGAATVGVGGTFVAGIGIQLANAEFVVGT